MPWPKGKPRPLETRIKISQSNKGRTSPKAIRHDNNVILTLMSQGYHVIRIWEHELYNELDKIEEMVCGLEIKLIIPPKNKEVMINA